jgi:uncharacterized integral membrane protein
MTYLRYALLAVVLLLAVTVALANRAPVTLALWPDSVTAILGFGYAVTLPLFVVVVGAVGLGLLMGLVWEWLRERGIRAEAARTRRELDQLRAREGNAAPAAAAPTANPAPRPGLAPQDEILALVDSRKSGA